VDPEAGASVTVNIKVENIKFEDLYVVQSC